MTSPKFDEELIISNTERILGLVDAMEEPRAARLRALFDSRVGAQFFTAPASSREEYHSCYPGGLAEHSLNVVRGLIVQATGTSFQTNTLVFVALCHDLGKAGDETGPLYVPTDQDWKSRRGEHYDLNRHIPYMTVAQRSLYLLQRFGVELSSEEYRALLLSDGQYVRENEPYRLREPDLAVLLHFADLLATRSEKPPIK